MPTSMVEGRDGVTRPESTERDRRLRATASAVLVRHQAAYPEDPEQAAEMTVRAAIDVLDEFKSSRSRKAASRWPGAATGGSPLAPSTLFRSLAVEDWSPIDERKRDEFVAIVRQATAVS